MSSKNLNPIYLEEKLFLGSLFSTKRPVELSGKAIRKHFAAIPGQTNLTNVAHNNKKAGKEIGKQIAKLKAAGKEVPENLGEIAKNQIDVDLYLDMVKRIKKHPIKSFFDGTVKRFKLFRKQYPDIEKYIVKDPELIDILKRINDTKFYTIMTHMNSSHKPFEYGDFVASTKNLPKYPGYEKIINSSK